MQKRYLSGLVSLLFSGVVLLIILNTSSCQSDTQDISQLREVCFDTEVLPIFQASCATTECHDEISAEDGYILNSYQGIIQGIKSGDPQDSKLYKTIIDTGDDHMPPNNTLPKESRTLIRIWIEQGGVNKICQLPPDSIINDTILPYSNPYVCFERDILPIMQSSCGVTACHDPFTMEEEFNFTNYQGILDGLIPGNPEKSKIYKSISEVETSNLMPPPPYNPLTNAQIDSIYNWILNGVPDEYCGEACDTTDITYATHLESIVATNCTGCHSGASPSGAVSIENYTDLVAAVNNGSVPAVLRAENGYSLMPLYGPLSECDIRKFEIWIDNGMQN